VEIDGSENGHLLVFTCLLDRLVAEAFWTTEDEVALANLIASEIDLVTGLKDQGE